MITQKNESMLTAINNRFPRTGQSLVETALVLPIVLFLVLGVFELGRIVFIFSAVNNASREAARFGAATGTTIGGAPRYLSCSAIRQVARETAFLSGLTDADIDIGYDTPAGNTMVGTFRCGDPNLDATDINLGDRIVVTVTRSIDPILPFLPSFSPTFVTARTILKEIVIGPVECSDGLDNDGDGNCDFDGCFIESVWHPPDPGCSGPDDTTEALCYRFTLFGQPTEGGNLSYNPTFNCSNRYIQGTVVDLDANPAERYIFHYWEWDGANQAPSPSTSVTMDDDKDVIAHFRLLTSELQVTKSAPASVFSEWPLTYVISVTNPFTDTARNLVVTDTLPADVEYQGWSSSHGSATCDETIENVQIVCTMPELGSPDTVTFNIEVITPVADYISRTITNTVTASAFEFDPDLTNNTAIAVTTVQPRAELTLISKTGPEDEVPADTPFDYTITVGNSGPSVATNVRITDELPGNFTFAGSVDGCTAPGTVVTCVIPQLDVGHTVSRTFTVQAPRNGTTFLNSARVTANEAEEHTGDNTRDAQQETEIYSHVDLDISMIGPPSVYRDVPFSYQLTVSNAGPSTADNVVIVDVLPDGISLNGWINHSGSGSCGQAGQTVTCSFGGIQSGQSRVITLNVVAVSDGTFDNTATVSTSTVTDPGSVLSATVTTAATTVVGLGIDKQAPSSVVAGDLFVYTIDVRNDGPSNATGVSVVDQLPANVAFERVVEAAGWTCGFNAGVVTCTLDSGTLLPGEDGAATLQFEVRVTSAANTSVTNTARLHANEEDPVSDSATTVITPAFDLSLAQEAPSSAGAPFTFYLYAANLGPRTATNVLVSDTLSGVTGGTVTAQGAGWSCGDYSAPTVTCSIGELAAGAVAEITITVTPVSDGTVSGTASVTADNADYERNLDNNSATHTTTVTLP